ncbi:zinc ABC transporter substrate-binding protein [Enterovibrio norvegicus]|uniref:High-affinity zinc uptake system protein ZnuA n=1 Tax=Enterovibrio norvegicus TaxID=188144 RepID=A0ABV4KZT2_9GAMM|nr:zinc ABC transporter substrate-binding protein [Enterovibrio norvegicus]OEF55995.1 zinc transporter [Enterovibrio norvegicus]PMI26766.1 zinc transporter [Enterovibrio norvegicus]
MRHSLFAYAALGLGMSFHVQATPSVAVDIAPLHSLVSQVMEGVGEPDLLIPAESSPHEYTLRPSQAKALSNADVVFWMGEGLTPWLEKALDNVAGSAEKVEMLALEQTHTHEYREGATFEAHSDHGDEHHDDDHHDKHDDEHHDDEKHHDEHKDHDGHKDHDAHKDEGGHHGHDHHGNDPHAWLDPENAKAWVAVIQEKLSAVDPDNASTYKNNAAEATASLNALIADTNAKVSKLGDVKFIVFHDAYQYFEKRFNVIATGAISLGDAEDPSPKRIKEIRETVQKLNVNCVFTEPQYNPGLVKNVFEGTSITTIGVMDPLGASIPEGSKHYQALIEAMVNSLSQCK